MRVPDEALRLLKKGRTVTEATHAWQRSKLSTRGTVSREANRRGLLAGMFSRVGRKEAAASANGKDPMYYCAVPERWRPLFERIFVKAAAFAARTKRTVTVRL